MLELFTFEGQWDLPSLDPYCLYIEMLLAVVDDSSLVQRVAINDPTYFPAGKLPVLKDVNEVFENCASIEKHLARYHPALDLDCHLTDTQRAESDAIKALIESEWLDALLYCWWCIDENRLRMAKWYAQHLPFPARVSLLYGNQLQSWVLQRLRLPSDYVPIASKDLDMAHPILKGVRKAYKAFARRLGDKQFVFGDRPSSLDCFAFAFLSLHLYADLPCRALQTMLNFEFGTLVEFTERFRHRFLRPLPEQAASQQESKADWTWSHLGSQLLRHVQLDFFSQRRRHQKEEERGKKSTSGKEENPLESESFRWTRDVSIAGAVSSLVLYTWLRGIVQN